MNAAWLRWQKQSDIQEAGGKVHTINPYSDMDILLKRLFQVEENIVWGNLNEQITFSHFSLKVTCDALKIELTIKNNGKSSEKLTTHNFFISDENLEQSLLNLEGFVFIPTMETVTITLTPSVLLPKMGFFNFQFDNNRLVMALGK